MDEKLIKTVCISSLLTLGNGVPQLKSHINGHFNIGCTNDEFLDIAR